MKEAVSSQPHRVERLPAAQSMEVAAALAAYVLLMGFNLSRMIFWQLTRLTGSPRAKERARHFTQVVAHARECWAEKG